MTTGHSVLYMLLRVGLIGEYLTVTGLNIHGNGDLKYR